MVLIPSSPKDEDQARRAKLALQPRQHLRAADAFRPQDREAPTVPLLVEDAMPAIEPARSWLLYITLVQGRARSEEPAPRINLRLSRNAP
jgi:hypothetical protein